MEKKYVVKDFDDQTYYCGAQHGWSTGVYFVEYFETLEDAKLFISQEQGRFQIEEVYFNL